MNIYKIEWQRFAILLLPVAWRKPLLKALWVYALNPLSGLHDTFMRFRTEKIKRLHYSCQVCKLRTLLNDTFDPISRKIEVFDEGSNPQYIIICMREVSPVILQPYITINRRGIYQKNGCDFWITTPIKIKSDYDRLSSLVNTYKLPSKKWFVEYI